MATSVVGRHGSACLRFCCLVRVHTNAERQFVETSQDAGFPDGITSTYGISLGDLGGDGLPDVFLNNHTLRNSIFRNGPGAAWIGFDNDGDQDLLIPTAAYGSYLDIGRTDFPTRSLAR